ncbi:SEC14-like protein 2 [Orchesella cincta]|uniref:SEC14-like protein 2 n=1 Tax=Orchesella cincta TaxID=48709 RepID=A0A1D2NI03_ORCCI|nr:SEC14-like protein 2 [Orchesella cincta]
MNPPTKEEVELLQELRKRVSDINFVNDEVLEDKDLVRFLRARSCNLDAAEIMLRNHHDWYIAEDMKDNLANYDSPPGWDDDFYYKLTGFDRTGCIVAVAPFGKWDIQKEMANGNKEEWVKFCYHQLERLWTVVKFKCKNKDHLTQLVGIADLEGFSLRQVTSYDVVEAAIRCLKAFDANYPESIKTVVIVNAPWAFQLMWKLIRPFLSEQTQSKLSFLGANKEKWRETMLNYCEADQFPEYYGGTLPDSVKLYIGRDGSTGNYSENQNEIIERK